VRNYLYIYKCKVVGSNSKHHHLLSTSHNHLKPQKIKKKKRREKNLIQQEQRDPKIATSGHAFPQCVFDHWDMMSLDPLEAGSQAATFVTDIRKKRGLKEQITPLSKFGDKL
jgi:hypothetical protein